MTIFPQKNDVVSGYTKKYQQNKPRAADSGSIGVHPATKCPLDTEPTLELVGGLEHVLFVHSMAVGNVVIPIDFHIFSEG